MMDSPRDNRRGRSRRFPFDQHNTLQRWINKKQVDAFNKQQSLEKRRSSYLASTQKLSALSKMKAGLQSLMHKTRTKMGPGVPNQLERIESLPFNKSIRESEDGRDSMDRTPVSRRPSNNLRVLTQNFRKPSFNKL